MKRTLLILYLYALCGSAYAATSEVVVAAGSFAHVVADAAPGQTLVLAEGVYRNVKLNFSEKGESDKPILLRAQTPGKVFIVDQSELTVASEHLVVSGLVFDQAWDKKVVELSRAQRCRLTDYAFIACGNPDSTFSHVVSLLNGSAWNWVDHCYFEGRLSLRSGGSALVQGNVLRNCNAGVRVHASRSVLFGTSRIVKRAWCWTQAAGPRSMWRATPFDDDLCVAA